MSNLSIKKQAEIIANNAGAWAAAVRGLKDNFTAADMSALRAEFLRTHAPAEAKVGGKRAEKQGTCVVYGFVRGALAYLGHAQGTQNSAESRTNTEDFLRAVAVRAGAEDGSVQVFWLSSHDGEARALRSPKVAPAAAETPETETPEISE